MRSNPDLKFAAHSSQFPPTRVSLESNRTPSVRQGCTKALLSILLALHTHLDLPLYQIVPTTNHPVHSLSPSTFAYGFPCQGEAPDLKLLPRTPHAPLHQHFQPPRRAFLTSPVGLKCTEVWRAHLVEHRRVSLSLAHYLSSFHDPTSEGKDEDFARPPSLFQHQESRQGQSKVYPENSPALSKAARSTTKG